MVNDDAVVIAEKTLHQGRLHGSVSCGGAVVNLSHGIALKFIAEDKNWCTIQVITTGIGRAIKGQSWQKTKKVVVKAPLKKSSQNKLKIAPAFEPEQDVKTRDVV